MNIYIFSDLISNILKIDSYNPYKQKLLKAYIIFKV